MKATELSPELRRGITAAAGGGGAEEGRRDLTQDGLALELGDRWREMARHVASWGRWLFWDGTAWRVDDRLEHMTRARAFLRELSARLGPEFEQRARKLRQADTVAKVVTLARSNVAQRASVGQWDADPYRLGHPDPEETP